MRKTAASIKRCLIIGAMFFAPTMNILGNGSAISQTSSQTTWSTETFAALPFVEGVQLSPDGTHIAGLFAVNGAQQVLIIPISGDLSRTVRLAVPDLTEVSWIKWVGNDNIIVGIYALRPVEGDNWYIYRMLGLNRTTGAVTRTLWDAGGQNASDVIWVPSDGSTRVLVGVQNGIYTNTSDFYPAVYKVDVTTGRKSIVEKGRTNLYNWAADPTGRVRIGIGYDNYTTKSTLLYRKENENALRTIDVANLGADEELEVPFYFVPNTDHGYVLTSNDEGRTIIAEVDLSTGKTIRTVYDEHNVVQPIVAPDGTKLLGVETSDRAKPIHWLDPVIASYHEKLEKASPQSSVTIMSFSQDLTKMVVRFSTPDNPGLLYYYDGAIDDLAQLASMNSLLGSKRLAPAKYVTYKARDGLEIEGILTLPRGKPAKNLPLIMMPHGGPWAHDKLGYNYEVQFLADRGYAVLQPNFRGSTGYGWDFERAGEGEIGLAMQDDLTDGVNWAVQEGIADPKRVCIVGGSYGGYAAMWGVAKDPDLYRCAISINGVSMLRKTANDFGGAVRSKLYRGQWQRMSDDFDAVSPINAVHRIQAPLLLIHGKKDVRVAHSQSAAMEAAMQRAGKRVELVSVPLADHYFTREADRLTMLKAMERFLAEHNPANDAQ